MLSWLIAYGITFAVIEPLQVCVIVCAPWLFDEKTRLGRFMKRLQYVYNEICAP